MHVVKKESYLVLLYVIQSLALVGLLAIDSIMQSSWQLGVVALVVFSIKCVFAPYFFYRFVRRRQIAVLTSTYLNVPLTLAVLVGIIFFSNSDIFAPLTAFLPQIRSLPMMIFSSIFMSIFILINRKGSLSQIIGILSVENTIVAFGFFLGLTQTFAIEIGIMFNILVWIVLATIFIELIYRQLGTTDVSELNTLQK